MKKRVGGPSKNQVMDTIKTSKNVGLGGPWYLYILHLLSIFLVFIFFQSMGMLFRCCFFVDENDLTLSCHEYIE